jgi:hypothetical protein
MVTGRRERRMAVRLAAERAALPVPADQDPAGQVAFLPSVRTISGTQTSRDAAQGSTEGEDLSGDDDGPDEIFDGPDDGDFYADAFEVLE